MNIKVIGIEALQDGFSYLLANPVFLVRAAVNAARLRLGIPLDALRWLIARLAQGPKVPKDIELRPIAPGLHVAGSLNMMGTPLRVSATLHFDSARATSDQVLLGVRVRDLAVKAPAESPVTQMVGALDLSKPGNLMMFLPRRPAALVEARDDLFVFDLLKVGKFASNTRLRRGLLALSEILVVRDLSVEDELLVLSLRALPMGLPAALSRVRAA